MPTITDLQLAEVKSISGESDVRKLAEDIQTVTRAAFWANSAVTRAFAAGATGPALTRVQTLQAGLWAMVRGLRGKALSGDSVLLDDLKLITGWTSPDLVKALIGQAGFWPTFAGMTGLGQIGAAVLVIPGIIIGTLGAVALIVNWVVGATAQTIQNYKLAGAQSAKDVLQARTFAIQALAPVVGAAKAAEIAQGATYGSTLWGLAAALKGVGGLLLIGGGVYLGWKVVKTLRR